MAAFERIKSGIPEMLEAFPDLVMEFESKEMLTDIVHVYDVSSRGCAVYNDIANEHLVIAFKEG